MPLIRRVQWKVSARKRLPSIVRRCHSSPLPYLLIITSRSGTTLSKYRTRISGRRLQEPADDGLTGFRLEHHDADYRATPRLRQTF
jgi:hypothetical protein